MIEQFYLIHRWDPNNITLGLSGPGSNDNEGAIHSPQILRPEP